jgi:phenylacetate-CoA ligase
MGNPRLLVFGLKIVPSGILETLGRIKTVAVFYNTVRKVPAYKEFLKANDIEVYKINNYKDFISKVPQTTKENYIYPYSITERCLNGKFPSSGNIDESAGSSGKATMWVRSTLEERRLHQLTNFALQYTFKAFDKDNLIVLNCWSTGPWATGVKFSQLAQNSTVVKCIGTDKSNVIDTIKTFGKDFEYSICGYPPFVKEILDYGDTVNMDWKKYKINIVTGGEGFSEGWRNYMRNRINGSEGEVYSAYGSSDIDIGVGFESNLTIKIKHFAENDIEFRKLIFGSERIPTFFGIYNPLLYHIENSETGEIIFTALNIDICSPKVRYNIKDSGNSFTYNQIKKLIEDSKYSKEFNFNNELKLPFFVIFGRSDGTISLDGGNIYPNDVQNALFSSEYAKFVNSFFIDVGYLKDESMVFKILIEMIEGKHPKEISEHDAKKLAEHVRKSLMKVNRDYKECWENNPESLEPRIEFYENNSGTFANNRFRIKNQYFVK